MDLLDAIEDNSRSRFASSLNPQNDDLDLSDNDNEDVVIHSGKAVDSMESNSASLLGLNFDIDAISKQFSIAKRNSVPNDSMFVPSNQLQTSNEEQDEEEEEHQEQQQEEEYEDSDKENVALPPSINKSKPASVPDLSILSRIKRRLNGEEQDKVEEDRVIDATQTTISIAPVSELPSDTLFDLSGDTQVIPLKNDGNSLNETQIEVQKLPQLAIDLSDFDTQPINDDTTLEDKGGKQEFTTSDVSTQVISKTTDATLPQQKKDLNSLFLSEEEDNNENEVDFMASLSRPLTKEERGERIARLAELKKKQRLERERQLQEDISHTTLTDDEADLNQEANETVVSNLNTTEYVSVKDLEESEKFLNVQKRQIDIRPEFEKKVVFTKSKLLDAFNESEDEDVQGDQHSSSSPIGLRKTKSTPLTSPVRIQVAKLTESNKSDVESTDHSHNAAKEDFRMLENPKQVATQTRNPIELYAQKLKAQLFSSPTTAVDDSSEKKVRLVNLDDSESDSEPAQSSPIKSVSHTPSHHTTSRFGKELDDIPQLTKDQLLEIRQKFSKRKLLGSSKIPQNIKNLQGGSGAKEGKDFLLNLSKANIQQLKINRKTDPDAALIDEMEKDEEIMGSLLEREMERVRNIRKKEKLREKATLALMGKLQPGVDAEYIASEKDAESEVPDSDYGSDLSASDMESAFSENDIEEDDQLEENNIADSSSEETEKVEVQAKSRRSNRLVISDDDEESESVLGKIEDMQRSDDSYMFGPRDKSDDEALGLDREELITTITTQDIKNVFGQQASLTQAFDNGTQVRMKTAESNSEVEHSGISLFNPNEKDKSKMEDNEPIPIQDESYPLFQNLQPRINLSQQSEASELDANKSFLLATKLPSLRDISEPSTQLVTQHVHKSTQADLTATQIDFSQTQVISKQISIEDDDHDDDEVTPFSVRRGRTKVRELTSNLASLKEDVDLENSDEEIDEAANQEMMQRKIKMYEEKIRRKELKSRKRRKEMERRGIKNIVQGEAEESEDEWKGLGGAEGEVSDQANSDDERMIDNNLFIDLKDEEIRRKFMDEYQIKDQKELEKLLDDIKNHRLIKRAAGNGLDIELSDEDDELLAAYRKQKLKEQQARLLQNRKLSALSKDEKSKAFFASIQDEESFIKIDDDDDDESEELGMSHSTTGKDSDIKVGNVDGEDEDNFLDKEAPMKKVIKIEESFVQKQLSFLVNNNDDYETLQRVSRFQHGVDSSDEEIEDVKTLKSRCMSNLTSKRSDSQVIQEDEISRKRSHEENGDTDVDDDDEDFMPSIKRSSIVKSYKSFQEQQGILIKDGKKHFSGVTVSKQYKQVSGSRATISHLSKSKNHIKQVKSLKEKRIEKSINSSKRQTKMLFSNEGFDP
ncbi:MRC1-like domain-containing protein [Scheffersomyces xylosifermentans]|uniref:MRC1-like domain-containing protein n=1 Tax=Scheffersomyces xylosifermentans TaxID=1304137 RepID=UPI00315DC501